MVLPYRATESEEMIPGVVSVLVLTYNTGSSLEPCLASVLAQSYTRLELIITDNASASETQERIKRFLKTAETPIPVQVDWGRENLGYAEGRNRGIRQSRGEYVLCLNHDAVLEEDFIEKAVATLKSDSRIGAVQGKLIEIQNPKFKVQNAEKPQVLQREPRAEGERAMDNPKLKINEKKEIIDTTGLVAYKSRYFANRGHGEEDVGQYERGEEVFGVDGAAPVYRRAALEDIRIPNTSYQLPATSYEYFDPDFFLYKEDIDLSWRLRLAGWKIVYQPRARAMNARTSKTGLNFLETRFKTSRRVRYFSFRNHHFLMLKNDGGWFFFAHLPWILGRELGYLAMSLLLELGNVVAVGDIIRLFPRMIRKRHIIMRKRRVQWKEVYKWFT